MDLYSVSEIISGQNTITAVLPLQEKKLQLLRLIIAHYIWKDSLVHK